MGMEGIYIYPGLLTKCIVIYIYPEQRSREGSREPRGDPLGSAPPPGVRGEAPVLGAAAAVGTQRGAPGSAPPPSPPVAAGPGQAGPGGAEPGRAAPPRAPAPAGGRWKPRRAGERRPRGRAQVEGGQRRGAGPGAALEPDRGRDRAPGGQLGAGGPRSIPLQVSCQLLGKALLSDCGEPFASSRC